jgi:hypothetical protein
MHKVAGILDIAAMKVIAVCQRGTKRDFIDLYFLLQEIPFHRVAEHMVGRPRTRDREEEKRGVVQDQEILQNPRSPVCL